MEPEAKKPTEDEWMLPRLANDWDEAMQRMRSELEEAERKHVDISKNNCTRYEMTMMLKLCPPTMTFRTRPEGGPWEFDMPKKTHGSGDDA